MISTEKNPDATIIVAAEPEYTPTVRGCAARDGFGASSIRQPRGALNSIDLCAAAAEVGTGVISSYSAGRHGYS